MSDEQVGAAVLGAAVAGLVGLWLFGAWGGIAGAIIGAIALPAILGGRHARRR